MTTNFHTAALPYNQHLLPPERHATSEDTDPGGMFMRLVEAQSTGDIRHLLAA